MALAPGQTFAGYEVLAEIGRGGMGAVYQARQLSLLRLVALKILPPHLAEDAAFAARFQAEAIAVANLNHPNIIQVFEAGESSGIRYIAMEYVEGETIQHRLRRCGRLPMTEALDVAYHVAAALQHAWQSGRMIHRDVKPDNIFLAHNGTVKLGDFGIAKTLREGVSSVTVTGHVLGSPHFISPEQARGLRDADFRADIYSLGCTLHYMMTGRTVFEGPDFVSIMYKHVNESPEPLQTLLPDCPAQVNRLIQRMLAKGCEQRPASYEELMEEIIHARDEASVWEKSDERQRRRMAVVEEPPGRSRLVYLVALLTAVVVAGGVVYAKRVYRAPIEARSDLSDPSDRRDFIAAVQRLPAQARASRVMDRLRELNPQFDGKEKLTIEDDMVTELTFSSRGVRNLWPLCALKHLRVLRLPGDAAGQRRSELSDLSVIRELPELDEVDCSWTSVEDLTPVAGAHLIALNCAHSKVLSLAPLKGKLLQELDVAGTEVADLTALSGLPLERFNCLAAPVRDLAPLRSAPLRSLACDLSVLRRHGELLKSWTQLETVNDLSIREFLLIHFRGNR